jgi:hypothetical protein
MVLDAVCDDNEVESVQLCSWWSNGANESSSVVLMDIKGTSINGRHLATAAAVGSRFSSWVHAERGRVQRGDEVLHKVMTDSARTGYRAAGLAAEATR